MDAFTADNGPLRVLPGTHREDVLTDAQVAERAARTGAVACLCPRGGVIAMRPLLIHASSKSAAEERRVVHIEYASGLNLGSKLQLAVV